MLLTKQQKFLLAALEKLGCAELRQLAALLQKMFAFSSLDDAVRVTGTKRDDLQAVMALLRKDVADVPLSFNNFRD